MSSADKLIFYPGCQSPSLSMYGSLYKAHLYLGPIMKEKKFLERNMQLLPGPKNFLEFSN